MAALAFRPASGAPDCGASGYAEEETKAEARLLGLAGRDDDNELGWRAAPFVGAATFQAHVVDARGRSHRRHVRWDEHTAAVAAFVRADFGHDDFSGRGGRTVDAELRVALLATAEGHMSRIGDDLDFRRLAVGTENLTVGFFIRPRGRFRSGTPPKHCEKVYRR